MKKKPDASAASPSNASHSRPDPARVVRNYAPAKVLIVGDAMLDVYLSGEADRISPEAPVPVVHVLEERHLLGGSGNVALNIAALGGQAELVGIRGDDQTGRRMEDLIHKSPVQASLVVCKSRPTTVKTRITARGQQMLRFDREDPSCIEPGEIQKILSLVDRKIAGCGAVIISDYGKGSVTPLLVKSILSLAGDIPVLVDPKPQNLSAYHGVSLLTPNAQETGAASGLPMSTPAEVTAAGRSLMRRLECAHLVTTLGPAGMAVFTDQETVFHVPTVARKVFDVTGAGDTVIAAIGLGLASGSPLLDSCIAANHAAGLVVGENGAATVSAAELLQAIESGPEIPLERW